MEHFYQNIGEDWFTYQELYRNMVYEFGDNSHFVEVGSWKGRSASYMAVEINNSGFNIKFDCIDTWKGSIEHQQCIEVIEDRLYEVFLNNIEPVKHLINPIRKASIDASKEYRDNSLDFVFIDGSHEYEDVLDDLRYWLPKVKPGGILAGHDYPYHPPIVSALSTFFKKEEYRSYPGACWIHEKRK